MFEPFMEAMRDITIMGRVETIPESLAMMVSALLAENQRLKNDLSRCKERAQGLQDRLGQKDDFHQRLTEERNALQRELHELREKRQKRRKKK